MDRKSFLKGLGLAGVGLSLPSSPIFAKDNCSTACVLIPTETAGPFPLDLTENTKFFRSTINETKTGVPLNVKLKVLGNANCLPMQNVRVNIWHCDKDGVYSGYDTNNNAGQAGLTYCRGYQMTDANGEVNFKTIFPGWYNGRICHIHFQVYVSSSYAAISQLTFPIATKNAIYTSNSNLYTKGADPMSLSADNIFSDGYQYQMATLVANNAGGYDTYLEITVQGTGVGTSGLGHIEKENAKQFTLGQNFPNPYTNETTIPFRIEKSSNVKIEIWNLEGKKMIEIMDSILPAGEHKVNLDLNKFQIPSGSYIYQIEVKNEDGQFRNTKMMTSAK
jgi:hypothetical protein